MTKRHMPMVKKSAIIAALLAWVAFGFYAVQFGLVWVVWGLARLWEMLSLPPVSIDATVASTVLSGVIYVASLALVVGVPAKWFKKPTTQKEMGLLQKVPTLRDVGLAPLVLFATSVLSVVCLLAVAALFEGFDPLQEQQIPFDTGTEFSYFQLVLVFMTLVIFAPIAEELLFRGYLYGKLRTYASAATTIVLTSLLFGALHLGIGPIEDMQWNVFVNTFTLALGMGLLREYTKSVWAGILVHMMKNFIAFLFLFVFTSVLSGVI